MKWTVLLSVVLVLSWIGESGGSSCTLMATASTDRMMREKLKVQLECGIALCESKKFTCTNIYEDLDISRTCSGEDCTKIYSLCESPNETCKNLNEVKFRTVVTSTSTVQPSPTTVQHCTTETVYDTETELQPTPRPMLCSCTRLVQEYDKQSCKNASRTDSIRKLSSGLGALVGLLAVALVIVSTGWTWTCWTMKKNRGMKVNSEQVRVNNTNINLAETDLIVSNNLAYANHTEIHRNPAYEDNHLQIEERDQYRAQLGPPEPAYEIIQPTMRQREGNTVESTSNEEGDTYDELNRNINS